MLDNFFNIFFNMNNFVLTSINEQQSRYDLRSRHRDVSPNRRRNHTGTHKTTQSKHQGT